MGLGQPRPRFESTASDGAVGSDKSGHIDAEPNESILFIDSKSPVFPRSSVRSLAGWT